MGFGNGWKVADLVFAEMAVRVEDFGFVVEFFVDFVVEMVMKVEGFDFEVIVADFVVEYVGEDNSNMMEDIDIIEKISLMDFVLLVPMVEIEIEVEAKVSTKNSNLVGAEDTFDC